MDSRVKEPLRQPSFFRRHMSALLMLALVALFIQGVFGAHGVIAMYRAKQVVKQVQREIDRLNKENEHLSGQVKALKSDPTTIERVAREEMGLARPGELIFKLPAKPNETAPTQSNAAPKPAPPKQ